MKKTKLRAVVYCRVSTNSDSQTESLDKQVKEAVDAVGQLGYELVDRFIDEGKTGTTKEARKEYLRMISQIGDGKFDVIVTKSLDRMNRNILDFYLFLDLIIKNDIKLYFYLDRAYYKTDDKIIIGIKAILAEEYSRELSKKLCNAHARRQERGEVVMLSSLTYGYRKELQPDGKRRVVIVEEEAQMIRLIIGYCKEGYGARAIGKMLYAQGYRNRNGKEIGESTIRRIIRNPLVMGTMIMNRVKFDFNSKKTIYNDPEKWIWKEGAVPAIVSEEDWRAANTVMDSRLKTTKVHKIMKKQGVNRGKYNFSGKLICGLCGKPYYKTGRENKTGRVIQWKCSTYQKFGRLHAEGFKTNAAPKGVDTGNGCDGPSLDEEMLIEILDDVAKEHFSEPMDRKAMIAETMSILKKVLEKYAVKGDITGLTDKIQIISRRQESLLEKYLDGKVSDENYVQMDLRLQDEREQLEAELANQETERDMASRMELRLKNIEDKLKSGGIEQATAYTLMDSVKQIVIYREHLEIIFDSLQILGIKEFGMLGEQGEQRINIPLNRYQLKNTNIAIEHSKERICEMIAENPGISLKQMAGELRIGARTAFERTRTLKEEGRIGVKGHGPGRQWYLIGGNSGNGNKNMI